MEQKEQHIVWHDDVVMKQFISYAVGCMMGRYRLDKKGLHIAHPNPTPRRRLPIYNNVKFEMEENAANLSTAERKKLDSIRKQIDECREYHDRLHVVADEQIQVR